AELLHEWNQLARHVGEGHEERREHDTRYGKDDADPVGGEPGPEPASHPEQEHEQQPGNDRGDGNRQVDQGDEQALAPEFELGDRPCRRQAKTVFTGTTTRAVRSVRRMAAWVSGSANV